VTLIIDPRLITIDHLCLSFIFLMKRSTVREVKSEHHSTADEPIDPTAELFRLKKKAESYGILKYHQ
jgi:hypothetical protein